MLMVEEIVMSSNPANPTRTTIILLLLLSTKTHKMSTAHVTTVNKGPVSSRVSIVKYQSHKQVIARH
jgi:hypothetical protein